MMNEYMSGDDLRQAETMKEIRQRELRTKVEKAIDTEMMAQQIVDAALLSIGLLLGLLESQTGIDTDGYVETFVDYMSDAMDDTFSGAVYKLEGEL